ncbi:MAG: glutathione S-transferase family protein [Proteobacteria bacterium]|jgi:glutathione S-transferase|nr:glutathione S-transferase family protein [Pseudomonadota bacterium]
MFILYNAPQSTCSQKVRLVMAEKALAFKEVKLNLFKGDQLTAEYMRINPNGVVPSLDHDGKIVIDSSVIIEYLDESFPDRPLRPDSPAGLADMRTWMRFFEEVPTPAVRVPSYNRVFLQHYSSLSNEEFMAIAEQKTLRKDFFLKMGRTGYSVEEMEKSLNHIRMTVERMEENLQDKSSWLLGKQYTLADICVLPCFVRMNDIGYASLWSDAPKVTAWIERSVSRDNYASAYYHGSLLSEKYPDVDLSPPK